MDRRKWVVLVVLGVMALSFTAAFAQTATPVPLPTTSELVTATQGVLTTSGTMVIVWAVAIVGLGTWMFRRFKSAAR